MSTFFVAHSLYGNFMGAFGLLALALATLGIYGVIAFSVARRRHDIGVRMALGATAGDIVFMILREGLVLTLLGGLIGIPGAFANSRILSALVEGVTPAVSSTAALAMLLLTAVAIGASLIPAYRASRLAPAEVLRHG